MRCHVRASACISQRMEDICLPFAVADVFCCQGRVRHRPRTHDMTCYTTAVHSDRRWMMVFAVHTFFIVRICVCFLRLIAPSCRQRVRISATDRFVFSMNSLFRFGYANCKHKSSAAVVSIKIHKLGASSIDPPGEERRFRCRSTIRMEGNACSNARNVNK